MLLNSCSSCCHILSSELQRYTAIPSFIQWWGLNPGSVYSRQTFYQLSHISCTVFSMFSCLQKKSSWGYSLMTEYLTLARPWDWVSTLGEKKKKPTSIIYYNHSIFPPPLLPNLLFWIFFLSFPLLITPIHFGFCFFVFIFSMYFWHLLCSPGYP